MAARLGIADLRASGITTVDGLAVATGADPNALLRLLRALVCRSILDEQGGGQFQLVLDDRVPAIPDPLLGTNVAFNYERSASVRFMTPERGDQVRGSFSGQRR